MVTLPCVCLWANGTEGERDWTVSKSSSRLTRLTCIIIEHSGHILRRESVRRVAHQHARFPHRSIADDNAFDESVGLRLRHFETSAVYVCVPVSRSLTLWPDSARVMCLFRVKISQPIRFRDRPPELFLDRYTDSPYHYVTAVVGIEKFPRISGLNGRIVFWFWYWHGSNLFS